MGNLNHFGRGKASDTRASICKLQVVGLLVADLCSTQIFIDPNQASLSES